MRARSFGARAFAIGLRAAAALARSGATGWLAERLVARIGDRVARRRGVAPAGEPRAIAEQWRRTFPEPGRHPITSIDDATATAFAEIHTRCPLRGTGDVEACHRLMAYDRAIAARAGATFVVLASQATPGVTVCKVALRRGDRPAGDLVPAHVLARRAPDRAS